MKVMIRNEIYEMYLTHKIDLNSYLKQIIVFLSLEHCKDLKFDFVSKSDLSNSIEVEVEKEIVDTITKFFSRNEDLNKIVNVISATGIMFGGVI